MRRNDQRTKQRSAELTDKYDRTKDKVTAIVLEPHFRQYYRVWVDPSVETADQDTKHSVGLAANGSCAVRPAEKEEPSEGREASHFERNYLDIDMALSQAPSMIATGQLEIDRTLLPIPGADGLYMVYNRLQEEWHLQIAAEAEPTFAIPEENVTVYSRCLIVRRGADGRLESLQEGDLESAGRFMSEMTEGKSKIWG